MIHTEDACAQLAERACGCSSEAILKVCTRCESFYCGRGNRRQLSVLSANTLCVCWSSTSGGDDEGKKSLKGGGE